VEVWLYLDDQQRKMDSATDQAMAMLKNFGPQFEREKAQQRTYDALCRKAKAGHVTGGVTFGYDKHNVCSADGQRQHVVRVINPQEAGIVRKIFTMYAGGLGISRIAKRLNADGIPAPRQSPRGWSPCAAREMLRRPIYRGQIVWNALEKIVRGGTEKRRRRPESEWVKIDAPDLRIISSDLWESVQARLGRTKDRSRPRVRDIESPYLLTGVCRCASCGGPIMMSGSNSPNWHRRHGKFYACSYHIKRGSSICRNAIMAPQEELERKALDRLVDSLHPRALA
jgi:hypothetical protein